jgi:hypothetical protein
MKWMSQSEIQIDPSNVQGDSSAQKEIGKVCQ